MESGRVGDAGRDEGQERDPSCGYFGDGSEPLRVNWRWNLDPSQSFFSFLGNDPSKEHWNRRVWSREAPSDSNCGCGVCIWLLAFWGISGLDCEGGAFAHCPSQLLHGTFYPIPQGSASGAELHGTAGHLSDSSLQVRILHGRISNYDMDSRGRWISWHITGS